MLLYLLIGRNLRKQTKYRKRFRRPDYPAESKGPKEDPDSAAGMLQRMIEVQGGFPRSDDNQVELLKDGKYTFERIFQALAAARHSIHLQYYIFEEGELADRLLQLFVEKEAAGVEVRLIYDGIGSYSLSRSYLRRLKKAGIEAHPFFPFRLGRYLSALNYRNHRKIIVVDGEIAFTGGINISDKYLKGDHRLGLWHDMHLAVRGSCVRDLNAVFINDWELVSGIRLPLQPALSGTHQGQSPMQVVSSGPDDAFPMMEQLYFKLINSARETLYITNPYLIPSPAILTAIHTAALSGVDVRILVSAKADSRLVNWCVRSYFQRFLKSGVRIYLYPEGFLHSKVITVDDRLCTVGTANVDIRSFQHNYEVNVLSYDAKVAGDLRADFLRDSARSIALNLDEFAQRPWWYRLAEGAARTLSPLL